MIHLSLPLQTTLMLLNHGIKVIEIYPVLSIDGTVHQNGDVMITNNMEKADFIEEALVGEEVIHVAEVLEELIICPLKTVTPLGVGPPSRLTREIGI